MGNLLANTFFERDLTHNSVVSGLWGDSSLHLVTASDFINVP